MGLARKDWWYTIHSVFSICSIRSCMYQIEQISENADAKLRVFGSKRAISCSALFGSFQLAEESNYSYHRLLAVYVPKLTSSFFPMTIPYNVDADPDPTSQIAWPAARHRQRTTSGLHLEQASEPTETAVSYRSTDDAGKQSTVTPEHPRRLLSTWNLITLSISMAGSQIAWTVELG